MDSESGGGGREGDTALALARRSLDAAEGLLEQGEWKMAGDALRAAAALVDWLAWRAHDK